jgi:tetratricopeptide (TPR) repeat protein
MGRELFADIAERLHEDPATDPGAASIAASRIRDLNATDVALGVLDRSLLDRAETAVETEFADQPDVRAQLEHSLGRTAFALGLYERADRLLTRAAETYERTGADSGAVAARLDVGRTALFAGDWDRAETEIRAATAASGRSPDAGGLLALQGGLLMGLLRMERHEWAAAETTFAAARGTARGMLGPDHEVTISADEGWAHALTFLERFDEAAELYGELVPRARTVLGAGSPTTYQIIHNAAMCNSRMGRYDEALALYREDLEGSRSALGSEHSEVHVSTVNLGRLLVKIERWEEAEKMGREALRIAETNMPPGSVPRGMSHGLLAEALCGQQRYPGCQAMSRGMVDALSRLGRTEELAVWNERAGATR